MGKYIIKLRRLCGHHRTIPTPYTLEDVTKEGDHPQYVSNVAEIWKGRYKDKVVALKILKVSHQDPQILGFKRVSTPDDPPRRAAPHYTDIRRSGSAKELY